MSIAFHLLTLLLATAPVFAIVDGPFVHHFAAFAIAIMLATAALDPQTEFATTARLLKRFSLAILFPILWMVLQIAPLPFSWLANPIWSSASVALNEPSLLGRISVDPGITFGSLIWYVTVLSLVIAASIVTKDRRRAEVTFLVLSAITTFIAAAVWLDQFSLLRGILLPATAAPAGTFVAMCALGTIVSTGSVLMAVERHFSLRRSQERSLRPFFLKLILGFVGIIVCAAASWNLAPSPVVAALTLGIAVIAFIATARRLELRPWLSLVLFSIFAATAGGLLSARLQDNHMVGIVGYATSASAESLALAQRALSAAPLLGNGVGTFPSLTAIYQDFGSAPTLKPPSTAVSIAIEWGQPALVILMAFVIQLFAFTFRGAIGRGRDSFFSSSAAASLVLALCEAFSDSSLLNPAVQTIIAVIVGLGLSQSIGRTTGLKDEGNA